MFEVLTFEKLMKCGGDCSKCVGMYPIWVWKTERGKKILGSHFLWESDGSNKPYRVESCADMKAKYKPFFEDVVKKNKTSGWHAFLFPSEELANIFHTALDCGYSIHSLYKDMPQLGDFEI